MPQRNIKKALQTHLVRLVLFCAFVTFSCATLQAASLFGKVIEVKSGDVITIFNMNRPVRVKLLGVAAPGMDQSFGDVAKKHLSDLVFEKSVIVNYSGISSDSSLMGRVLLNDADIGAQMIRDGAAWFDSRNGDRLAALDRDVYQQSEQAARSERRGLWQDPNPVAPWEFGRTLKKPTVVAPKVSEPSLKVVRGPSGSELTNLSMISPNVKTAVGASIEPTVINSEIIDGDLPAGLPFIAYPPRNGTRVVKTLAFGLEIVKSNTYVGWEGTNLYMVNWLNTPAHGEDDKTAVDVMVFNELLAVAAGAFNGGDPQARCTPQSEKDVSVNGYWGRELDLSNCAIPTRVRVFTKATGDRRELYVAVANAGDDDERVTRFIKTFTIRAKNPGKH